MFPHPARRAFTLLEICVVMFIAMMIMGLALPSLAGIGSQRRLQQTFDRIDALAVEAQTRSIQEGKPFVLVWGEKDQAVRLYPAEWTAKERRKGKPLAVAQPAQSADRYVLERPASLSDKAAPAEWTFWPTGNCEPVVVRYRGAAGEWDATYNPLSARANLDRFIAQ